MGSELYLTRASTKTRVNTYINNLDRLIGLIIRMIRCIMIKYLCTINLLLAGIHLLKLMEFGYFEDLDDICLLCI